MHNNTQHYSLILNSSKQHTNQCTPIHTNTYLYIPIHYNTDRCILRHYIPTRTDTYQHIPMYTNTYRYDGTIAQIYTCTCLITHLPTYLRNIHPSIHESMDAWMHGCIHINVCKKLYLSIYVYTYTCARVLRAWRLLIRIQRHARVSFFET